MKPRSNDKITNSKTPCSSLRLQVPGTSLFGSGYLQFRYHGLIWPYCKHMCIIWYEMKHRLHLVVSWPWLIDLVLMDPV